MKTNELKDDDKFLLIDCVKVAPALWDVLNKNYKLKNKSSEWSKVCRDMNDATGREFDVSQIKQQWETLRRQFNNNKNNKKTGDGAESGVAPKWRFFDAMLFVECKDVKLERNKRKPSGQTAKNRNAQSNYNLSPRQQNQFYNNRNPGGTVYGNQQQYYQYHQQQQNQMRDRFSYFGSFVEGAVRDMHSQSAQIASQMMQAIYATVANYQMQEPPSAPSIRANNAIITTDTTTPNTSKSNNNQIIVGHNNNDDRCIKHV